MTLRPPGAYDLSGAGPTGPERPVDVLDHEIAQEKASSLGRLGRRFEASLAALAAHDAAGGEPTRRRELVAAAGAALWEFVVQREACGLRDSRQLIRDYRVPPEVVARMGLPPPPLPDRLRR